MQHAASILLLLAISSGCGRIGFELLSSSSMAQDAGSMGQDASAPSGLDGSSGTLDGGPASPDGGALALDSGATPSDAGARDAGRDAAVMDGAPPSDAAPGLDAAASSGLRIAVLPYGGSDADWSRVALGAPAVSMAVLNPASGPGRNPSQVELAHAQQAQAAGIVVLGYVPTMYTNRSRQSVLADIDNYDSWYGVDGIYLDQSSPSCDDLPYYQELFDYIKARSASARVVLDPGTQVPECFMAAADVLVLFQDTLARYDTFALAGWESSYEPGRFWHLIYDAPSVSDLSRAVDLAAGRNVGFIYVTPDGLPDPWDTLPDEPYWSTLLDRAAP